MSMRETTQLSDHIARDGLLDTLTDAQVATIMRYLEPEDFQSGERILAQGDADRSVYIVNAGRLDIVIESDDRGRSSVVGEIRAGDVLGEIAFFDGLPRTASIIARSDGSLLRLSHDSFERLCRDDPELALNFVCDLARLIALHFRQALARRD